MAEDRTFKLDTPHQHGEDVHAWQDTLNRQMRTWSIPYRVKPDSDYGAVTRDLTATVLYGLGIDREWMAKGVTPDLRIKVRGKQLTPAERTRFIARAPWRARLRKQHTTGSHLATPIAKILGDSWGWHPGVHDGVDLICGPSVMLYALCDGEVIRADGGGWWGLGAPADPAVRGRGDGIIVLRCSVNVGPFREGLNFGYGHAEHPLVRAGDHVKAGTPLGHAGFANAWHVHMMANARSDAKGVGDRDPKPYVDFARKHG
jgi:murein DD-endopeptidase MepM/ murein hydrolase activator NlpD